MATYLVTGGAGFIGSHLVKRLAKKGKVRVIDNFSTGKKENIEDLDVELIEADIRDLKAVKKVCKEIDCIFHLAAIPSVSRSLKDPFLTNETNIKGTLNILIAARENRVKRIIYSSSSSIYGEFSSGGRDKRPKLPAIERMAPNPISPYGVSKLVAEHYCQLFFELYQLENITLRYFNVFGERQNPKGEYAAAIPKFITAALKNQRPTIYGDGEQSRDFTYVGNAVEGTILASEVSKEAVGQIFNIATGKARTVNEILFSLNKILHQKIKPVYTRPRPGETKDSHADISKAKNLLGYLPKIDFEEGLKKTIDWFKEARAVS